jgi:hypothetical protein
MEEGTETMIKLGSGILAVAVILIVGIQILTNFNTSVKTVDTQSTSSSFIASASQTLDPIGNEGGITSATVQTYNQTWLDFDGVNDVVVVESSDIAGVTFWYKNSTSSDWIFIVNNSGVTFVNAVAGTPVQYPVYHNSTHYFLGMTDASTYFNGSIDDFRVYGYNLNTTQINSVYSEGRQ